MWTAEICEPTTDKAAVIAIPFLVPESNCKLSQTDWLDLTYGRVVYSSQQKVDRAETQWYLKVHPCHCQDLCFFNDCDKNDFYNYTFGMDIHTHVVPHNDANCILSWPKLCTKNVTGLHTYFCNNPTFMAVFAIFTSHFQQVLAIYPQRVIPVQRSNETLYTYHIIHSRHHKAMLRGFTIQNPSYDSANVTLVPSMTATGLTNMTKVILLNMENSIDLKCFDVLWIEPVVGASPVHPLNLSGSIVYSTIPLNVFTNLASLTDSIHKNNFSYHSQLVHQMPERAQWGKTFIVSAKHFEIVPEKIKPYLEYEISIISYAANNRVLLKTGQYSQSILKFNLSNNQYESILKYTHSEMSQLSHFMQLKATHPILVVLETYTNRSCKQAIHYSILVQPVEWYANKQMVTLIHPMPNASYHYLINIVAPSKDGNPANIMITENDDDCQWSPIATKYSVQEDKSGDYNLFTYTTRISNSTTQQTDLRLQHSNSCIKIGVTIYGYSEGELEYAYSNGYTFSKSQYFRQ